MEFLFYLIYQLIKFLFNWKMGSRLISQNLEISMFCLDLKRKLFLPVNTEATSQILQTALITFICGVAS